MRHYFAVLAFTGLLCLAQGSHGGDMTLLGAGKRAAAGGGSSVTWDPSNALQNMTLSGSNLIATSGAGAIDATRITTSHSSGKYYIEASTNDSGAFIVFGLQLSTYNPATAGNIIGYDGGSDSVACSAGASALKAGSTIGSCGNTMASSGDKWGAALDIANNKVWFRIYTGGSWSSWDSNATHDPATNTGGYTALGAGTYYVGGGAAQSGSSITLDPTCAQGPTPSGFTCWN